MEAATGQRKLEVALTAWVQRDSNSSNSNNSNHSSNLNKALNLLNAICAIERLRIFQP
jgi:hypothetical protein